MTIPTPLLVAVPPRMIEIAVVVVGVVPLDRIVTTQPINTTQAPRISVLRGE